MKSYISFFLPEFLEETLIIHKPTLLHLRNHRCLYQTLGKLKKERDTQHDTCAELAFSVRACTALLTLNV